MRNQKLITFMGQTLNIAQWARKYGIRGDTLARRLRTGMPFKDALFATKHIPKKIVTPDGAQTISEIAKAAKTSKHAIYTRRRRGWKTDELAAFSTRRMSLTAFGRTQSVKKWSEETGLPRTAIHERIRHGWEPEQALTMPLMSPGYGRHVGLTAFGKTQSIGDWAREVGINKSTLHSRLCRGLSPEVALKAPVAKRDKNLGG